MKDSHSTETKESSGENQNSIKKVKIEGAGFLEICGKSYCDDHLLQTILENHDGFIEEYIECKKCKTQYSNIYKPEAWREL